MTKKLKLVICWHMHQPWYKNGLDGSYHLPWVYLHAIKDYADMAWHLENNEQMRCVINFAPVLLDQLDDYARQMHQLVENGIPTSEPLLNYLSGVEQIPDDIIKRKEILEACRRANASTMILPYPDFSTLLEMADTAIMDYGDIGLSYLSRQFYLDLLTWYHLSWCGSSLREEKIVSQMNISQNAFSHEQRVELTRLFAKTLASIIPRYKALARRNRIEISTSPYSHPIIPLLTDFENTDCSQPDAPMPHVLEYPGGKERALWHIKKAKEVIENYFGIKPVGIWLSEGAISDDAIEMIEDEGFLWTASGEGVWYNTSYLNGFDYEHIQNKRLLFSAFRLKDYQTRIFFRDDGMSDLIGFEYNKRDPHQATDEFCNHLQGIYNFLSDDDIENHVVSIILDGENAWEYFPDNANEFLHTFYDKLTEANFLELSTFSECTKQLPTVSFQTLCPGSWVYGSFSTWIGEEAKNRAWEMLVAAKKHYDTFVKDRDDEALIQDLTRQLAICEASDWFWWFGEYNSGESVKSFDRLFRNQLKVLYQMMEIPAPDTLYQSVNKTLNGDYSTVENAGTMRRGNR